MRRHRSTCAAAVLALALVGAAGCSGGGGAGTPGAGGLVPTAASATGTPGGPVSGATSTGGAGGTGGSSAAGGSAGVALDVQVLTRGLSHGWDIGFLPDGNLLVSERQGRFSVVDPRRASDDAPRRVAGDLSDVYARGEGGLLGFVLHPDFAASGLLTACLDHAEAGAPVDVRLVTYRLPGPGPVASRRLEKVKDLVTGLPINPSGRHSGCRPAIAADGALIVGTGDTANGRVSQDRTVLGGKTLRLDLTSGQPAAGNPFASAANAAERYVYTYGHRNVQGVAVQPGTGAVYTVEHGPDRDDEVNRLKPGGNYGWDPSAGGTRDGYDESVPMTDLTRFPDAVPAAWSSGLPTLATSGAAFLSGPVWGPYDGWLAVTALKASKLLLMRVGPDGKVTQVVVPKELDGTHGRLRAARLGPDGALYVTSSNGDADVLLKITRKA